MSDAPDDAVGTEAQDAPYPSSEEIRELPDHIRSYIHDLETRCDPAGDLRRLDAEKQKRRELQIETERLREALQKIRREANEQEADGTFDAGKVWLIAHKALDRGEGSHE